MNRVDYTYLCQAGDITDLATRGVLRISSGTAGEASSADTVSDIKLTQKIIS